jgi:preprotein translocase subunit YajC
MDPLTIGMLAILAVLIFFMFRNSRKRKQQMEELRSQIVPGAEIMTNFGLYGTLRSIDEASKVAEVEVSPGTIVRVHSQTIAKVVDEDADVADGSPRSVEEAMEIANREAAEREERQRAKLDGSAVEPVAEPAYGERVEPEVKKPVRRTTKKVVEEPLP